MLFSRYLDFPNFNLFIMKITEDPETDWRRWGNIVSLRETDGVNFATSPDVFGGFCPLCRTYLTRQEMEQSPEGERETVTQTKARAKEFALKENGRLDSQRIKSNYLVRSTFCKQSTWEHYTSLHLKNQKSYVVNRTSLYVKRSITKSQKIHIRRKIRSISAGAGIYAKVGTQYFE